MEQFAHFDWGHFRVCNSVVDTYGPKHGPMFVALYCTLARYADCNTGKCYPSIPTLAQTCGMSPNSIRSALRIMVEEGLLRIEPRMREDGACSSNLYTLVNPMNMLAAREPGSIPTPSRSPDEGVPVRVAHGGSCTQRRGVLHAAHGGPARSTGGPLHAAQGQCEQDSCEQDSINRVAPSGRAPSPPRRPPRRLSPSGPTLDLTLDLTPDLTDASAHRSAAGSDCGQPSERAADASADVAVKRAYNPITDLLARIEQITGAPMTRTEAGRAAKAANELLAAAHSDTIVAAYMFERERCARKGRPYMFHYLPADFSAIIEAMRLRPGSPHGTPQDAHDLMLQTHDRLLARGIE